MFFAYKLLDILCKKHLRETLKDYCIGKFKLERIWVLIALILPLAVVSVYLLFTGSFVVTSLSIWKKLSIITAGIFFVSFACGFVEEMVFRGMIMNALKKKYSRVVAIVAPSLLFGIVHILGMNFNVLSCILVIIAGTMVGIMFSLITELTGSVWNSAIVHSIWNLITCSGLLFIGNKASEDALINYVINNKSFIVTGGEFGIESSLIALIGYILVSAIALAMLKNKPKKNSH